jgi:hypothetical protein
VAIRQKEIDDDRRDAVRRGCVLCSVFREPFEPLGKQTNPFKRKRRTVRVAQYVENGSAIGKFVID